MHDINFTLTFASLYSYSRTEQNRTWYLFHIAVLLICGVSKYRLYITYMYTCNRLYCFIYVLSCMIPIYLVQVADSPYTTPLLHNLDPRQSFKKTIATVLFLLTNFRLYSSKPRLQGFKTLLPLIILVHL